MPHSVPFERSAKQSSSSANMPSGILSGTATKNRSSSTNNSSSIVSGRVRKYASSLRHQTTTNGERVEEYARTVFPAEATIDGWQDEKAQDVMMNDAFSSEAIQEMSMNISSNSERLWQVPPGAVFEFDPNIDPSRQESLSKNLSTSEIEPFPQYSSTRAHCTYRKPLPPPAFPSNRQEGWCLRDKLRMYRKSRFNQISREKDPVDRLIHWYLEKVAAGSRPKRQLSLYHQKLNEILTTTKYLYDSTELCKERAKALQHEPVKSSPLREYMRIEDEWEIAEDIENFFEQWLTRYEDLYQPEEMNWEGVERSVSKFVDQLMDWESDVPPVVSSSQLSMNGGSMGPLVPPVAPETEYGNGGQLDAMIKDLIVPNLAVPKSSTG